MPSFVKKTGMPERNERKRVSFLESLRKIETPRKGQNTSDTLPSEANHRGMVEMNYSQGFSCTKVNLGLL